MKDLTSHYGHVNNGKGIDEVGERQKRRKLASLRETCKRALWFTDSFNVDLLGIIFKTKSNLEEISIDYNNPTISSSSSNSSSSIMSSSDTTESQTQLRQILYLLDRFAVSDEFYHELSMVSPTLPKSYKVKKVRELLNNNVELKRLPSPYSGCYRSVTECLHESLSAEVKIF